MAIKFLSGQTISGTLTVSGNVQGATFNGLAINTTGTNNVANQIVRTQANGYVNFGWINSISGNHTGSITRITASNDAYLRYVTPAQFRTGVTDGFYAPSSTVSGVTSVGGTGTVSGITLTGTVTSTGNLTLGGTLSASITNISNASNWWNNFGDVHGTRTGFDASTASYSFGWRYVQGNTNGPGTGGTQFYSAYVGLGSQYPATGSGSYGAYLAFDRNVANPYLSIRYNEANVLGTWKKISAGTADILTTARTIAGVSFNGSANISLNNNAITNGAGYTTNTGTVTSVNYTHQGNAFTVGGVPVTSSGTIAVTMAGSSSQYINGAGNLISFPTIPPDPTGVYLPLAGGIMSGNIGRSAYNSGYQVGGYNNIGASHAKTNPIHVIGTSYEPTATALSNMYGIGYTRADISFMGVAQGSGWGLYVASDGDARIFLDGSQGDIYATNKLCVNSYANQAGGLLFSAGQTTGTTRSLNLRTTNVTSDPSSSDGSNSTGITWGQRTDSNPYYIIKPTQLNFGGGNYSKLTLNWHTGIRIGGQKAYGGTKFYNDAPDIVGETGVIMNVGVGNDNIGVVNNLTVGSNLTFTGQNLRSTVGLFLQVDSGNVNAITIDNVGSTTFSGYTYFPNYLFHAGDTNTRIEFTTGTVTLRGDTSILLDGPVTANSTMTVASTLTTSGQITANGVIYLKDRITLPASGLSSVSGRPAYNIYQEGGAWTSPFPDLCIAMHTGIKFGAHASYNGMRFYDDYTMATQVMSVNNVS